MAIMASQYVSTVPQHVAIHTAKTQLTRLAARAEAGERITITRRGKPIADLVPHAPAIVDDPDENFFDRVRRIMAERGVGPAFSQIAPDFDDPLPDSFWFPDPDKFSRNGED